MIETDKLSLAAESENGLESALIEETVAEFLRKLSVPLKRVLLVPPDITRFHSGAGVVAGAFQKALGSSCHLRVLPAVGTHEPMSRTEVETMYPGIPFENFLEHNWRDKVTPVGTVSAEFMEANSSGWVKEPLSVDVSSHLFDDWDLIVSIGQVVPHEVAGMANYTKNIVIGCGGKKMIDHSHMLSAIYGIERTLGEVDNPVRSLLDHCQDELLTRLPLVYFLTVTEECKGSTKIAGLFASPGRECFEEAAALSARRNIHWLEKRLDRVLVKLDSEKFKSTWLGNKAIYRTRMVLADNAELIVMAGGVRKFGEDRGCDQLIRKYGYRGREEVLELVKRSRELSENLSVAAHLIHGSSDGRFSVTYAVDNLSAAEIEGVGYNYLPYKEALERYPLDKFQDGANQDLVDDGGIYYVSNPALALWRT